MVKLINVVNFSYQHFSLNKQVKYNTFFLCYKVKKYKHIIIENYS